MPKTAIVPFSLTIFPRRQRALKFPSVSTAAFTLPLPSPYRPLIPNLTFLQNIHSRPDPWNPSTDPDTSVRSQSPRHSSFWPSAGPSTRSSSNNQHWPPYSSPPPRGVPWNRPYTLLPFPIPVHLFPLLRPSPCCFLKAA